MGYALRVESTVSDGFTAWSRLPHIDNVTDQLWPKDIKFLNELGLLLANVGQARRFAVTLLHSHFSVKSGEILVEQVAADRTYIATRVQDGPNQGNASWLVPKSWLFQPEKLPLHPETLEVLTWTEEKNINYGKLCESDAGLLRQIAALFRSSGAVSRFGLALVGTPPDVGNVWTEGSNDNGRFLVQEQVSANDPRVTWAINTMWQFDDTGKRITTLGCCKRTRSGDGHTGTVHPKGW